MGDNVNRFKTLRFHQNGSSPIDAHNQDVATVDFRIFAQTSDPELVRPDVPNGFNRWCLEVFLQSAPGLSLSNDLRQIAPKPQSPISVHLRSRKNIRASRPRMRPRHQLIFRRSVKRFAHRWVTSSLAGLVTRHQTATAAFSSATTMSGIGYVLS